MALHDLQQKRDGACALLESDIEQAVADVTLQTSEAAERASGMSGTSEMIAGELRNLAEIAGGTSVAVGAIAAATAQVSAAGQHIAGQAGQSRRSAAQAVVNVEQAAAVVHALREAASGIGVVLSQIKGIANRTHLLALNANIEAARAGPAGLGFAVVAAEVKALASQTKAMTDEIAQRTRQIAQSAHQTEAAMTAIGCSVRQMDEANSAVAAAVGQQDAAMAGIAGAVVAAAKDTSQLSAAIDTTARIAAIMGGEAAITATSMGETSDLADELIGRLIVSLRAALLGSIPVLPAVPVDLPACLAADGHSIPASVLNLAAHGALVRVTAEAAAQLAPKGSGALTLEGIGTLTVQRAGGRGRRRHLQFTEMGPAEAALLHALIERTTIDDRRFIDAARDGARRLSACLADAIARGRITEADLFDANYLPVPGSDPPQFMARFTLLTDDVFPPIQEACLGLDPRVQFAAAVDRNGYLPTHNRKYCHAQKPGNRDWNAANCRNRRIFNDRAGLSAARCTGDHRLQSYERNMGGGQIVTLKEADVPILVRGRHWGGFRLSYRAN